MGRIGLGKLSGAETPGEAGGRLAGWFNEIPPMSEEVRTSGLPVVDIVITHGMAERYGLATTLHPHPDDPRRCSLSLQEAEENYPGLGNATADVLLGKMPGQWTMLDRILLPGKAD